ncbi:unnamed protein product [Prunus armeniaca]|uniref:Aminotransferase-like plant mobile domain-containing protein n=1 Tax=Prunus armeniaca TaxID=36596 RepID=A0A6J5X8M9_PRUAR|nr:unnamed protein product [Prunus armeniaca]
MKVNNEIEGDKQCLPRDEFYPVMHRMLRNKISWGSNFKFFRRANFRAFVLEWMESILSDFGDVLRQANIYGAVAVSWYSYEWRAFCELWGPLSNTFHHGNGEMGISLYDLKVIGGLPILGLPYDEFIPLNKELCREDLYPSTVGELLKIHAQLCVFHKKGQVFHDQWIEHFFRGEAIYGAAGNNNNIIPKHKAEDLKFPLNISREGQLAAFLAFWLSRFVLPLDNAIRPECFYMASLMARGFRVSLAPAVLGLIYHALGTVVTHRKGPGLANAYLPIHYVIVWLGEHFPDLIDRWCDNDFPAHYPLLASLTTQIDLLASLALIKEFQQTSFYLVYVRGSDAGLRSWREPKRSFCAKIPRRVSIFCAPPALENAIGVVDKHVPRRDHVFVTDNLKSISTGMSKSGFNSSLPPHGASSSKGHKKRIRRAKGKHFSGVNHVMHQSQRVN